MRNSLWIYLMFLVVAVPVIFNNGYALDKNTSIGSVFEDASGQAVVKDGVKEITYEQFISIRNSGEKYVLLDARSKESFDKGHIQGAKYLPGDLSTPESVKDLISKDDKIVVYCASFECHASTAAAKRLMDLGYNVLDYKGGIKDWQEKGNNVAQ